MYYIRKQVLYSFQLKCRKQYENVFPQNEKQPLFILQFLKNQERITLRIKLVSNV